MDTQQEEGQKTERRVLEQRRFRLDTTINISHIATTVGLIVAVFSWKGDIEKALVRQDGQTQQQQLEISYLKERQQQDVADVREALRDVNRKLDKLVDDSSKRRRE